MGRTISVWAIVFLVVLRLAIGWQFFMEGSQKVRSNYVIGPSEVSKPFSSEGYFRGSTGPFASIIRGQLPDPDEQVLALTLVRTSDKGDEVPAALDRAWKDHQEAFLAYYQLDPKQLDRAADVAKQQRENYVLWLRQGKKEVDRKFGTSSATMTLSTQARIDELTRAIKEFREYDNVRWRLGRDVDKEDQALARAKVIELRTALKKDIDDQTAIYTKALADVVRGKAEELLAIPSEPNELIKLVTDHSRMYTRWGLYIEHLKPALKLSGPQSDASKRILDRAHGRFTEWLADTDVQGTRAASMAGVGAVGDPLVAAVTAAARSTNPGPPDQIAAFVAMKEQAGQEELAKATTALQASIKSQDNALKAGLDEILTETQKSIGVPKTPEGWTFIKTLDLATIGVITGAGLMLMLGLFTRTACVLAAGFLLLTFLSAPPFPWLPLPPGTEGNPVYVNKNLIEFIALLALAGTASGRWFGVDKLIHWFFGKPEPESEGEPAA